MLKSCRFSSVLLLSCALVLTLPAQAGLFDDNEARKAILDLRSQSEVDQKSLQSLHTQLNNQAQDIKDLRRALLDLSNQLDLLQKDLNTQRGTSEELIKSLQEINKTQSDTNQLWEERFRTLSSSQVKADGVTLQATANETESFQEALAAFKNGHFKAAQEKWQSFLQVYPNSAYLPSVWFWLGSTQYALRLYKDAIESLGTFQNTAPPIHNRLPESWLLLADCQSALKDKKAAKQSLKTLLRLYPDSEAAATATTRL